MKSKTVIVIGAGIGGICAATHLAKAGFQVTVMEKNTHPGGRCDHLARAGHIFDTGPTLLVMRQLYEEEFAELGVSMAEVLDLQRVDPTYHLVFDDGQQLALTSDMFAMRRQLEAIEPGAFQGFLRYVLEGQRHYQAGVGKMVKRDFRKPGDFFNLGNFPLLYEAKPLVNHYRNMSSFFKSPRLKEAFTFQDVYMGLSPYEAPATFSFMPYTELAHGVWYPKGGMYSLTEALVLLARQAGVEFCFEMAVERIVVQGERARGVELRGGQRLDADVVIANADLPYVYEHLLPHDEQAEALRQKRFSCSALSFFWGVDKPYPSLPPHTLFLSEDYHRVFETIIDDLGLPENPCVYIHAPARLDAAMAPAGQETLTAVIPLGHLSENGGQNWPEIQAKAREHVFRRLALVGITDLQAHIKFETIFSPLSWKKRYNLEKGATHGLCHNLLQMGYFRPRNRHARYHNLFFTGASTHPGTGLPTAMVSGRHTARRVMDEIGI